MTTVVNPGTAETHNTKDIERILSAQFRDYLNAERRRTSARDDAEIAAEQSRGARETVITKVADLAHKHAWSADDVKDAVGKVISEYAGNDKKKASSVATFKSEVMLASDRRVRAHVATTFDLARKAFEAEAIAKAGDKDAPTPLRKAFSRAYHAAIAVLQAYKADDTRAFNIETVDDLTAYAVKTTHEKKIDYMRVKKRLEAIRVELAAFYDDFPVDGIQVCTEYLKKIDTDQLKEARASATKDDGAVEDDDAPEPQPEPQPRTVDELADAALNSGTDASLDMYAAA